MPDFTQLTATAFDHDYYRQHAAEGLDYLHFGPWQLKYGRWLVDVFELRERQVLDVGCACGALTAGLAASGARCWGVDVSEEMIRLGRTRFCRDGDPAPGRVAAHNGDDGGFPALSVTGWPATVDRFAPPQLRLTVCNVSQLHYVANESIDFLHSHQSAEHWPAALVPQMLRELWRVARPGASFFCVLDTAELQQRQQRDLAAEDPTHVCIRSLRWWHAQLRAAGFRITTEEHRHRLLEHGWSYLEDYDWDWWVAERLGKKWGK